MTFYNYIENVRYEMFKLVNSWTHEGAETKARISESLDKARRKYVQKESENAKLRKLIIDVHEALKADRVGIFHKQILANMENDMHELGIEVA